MREKLINTIASFGDRVGQFSDTIANIGGFCLSILGFIRYSFRSLLVGIWGLITRIIDSEVFLNVNRALLNLSHYIGVVPTLFIYAMLFIVIVRILIHFILHIGNFSSKFKGNKVDINSIDLPGVDDDSHK